MLKRLWNAIFARKPSPPGAHEHWKGGSLEAEVESRARDADLTLHQYAEHIRGEQVLLYHNISRLESIMADAGLVESDPDATRTLRWAVSVVKKAAAACHVPSPV